MYRYKAAQTGLSLAEMVVILFLGAVLLAIILVPLSHRGRSQRMGLFEIEEALRLMKVNECYRIIKGTQSVILLIYHKDGRPIKRIPLSNFVINGASQGCRLAATRALINPGSLAVARGTCFSGTTPAAGGSVCINPFGVVYRLKPGESVPIGTPHRPPPQIE